ncbi:MAG: adenine nucleotide alpha hydrolase [bacterium]|nr:adenine nucleotide alpha hydrolase [bacterium]
MLLSWSSGKDSAWALHVLRRSGADLRGLITSCNAEHDRVAMHGVRRSLLEAQAEAIGLPIECVELPFPCTNEEYETRMDAAFLRAKGEGVRAVAFGDLFLEDIRDYRIEQMKRVGLEPVFPIWGKETRALAGEMMGAGIRAALACVDPKQIDRALAGHDWDESLLARLPEGADPCGENGEFHTFVYDSPDFAAPIPIECGEIVEREGFVFADVVPAEG